MEATKENPSSVRVRKLEPWVITTHTRIAQNLEKSLEQHLRDVLTQHALKAQEDFAKEMRKHRTEIAEKFGTNFPKSEDLIRAVREESC